MAYWLQPQLIVDELDRVCRSRTKGTKCGCRWQGEIAGEYCYVVLISRHVIGYHGIS